MTQHKRCKQCQQFFCPEAVCFRCSAVDWLLSLSRWERMQLIWFLLHPPAPEPAADEKETLCTEPGSIDRNQRVETAVAQSHPGGKPDDISKLRP